MAEQQTEMEQPQQAKPINLNPGRNRIGPRGYKGRGGGRWPLLPIPPAFRGTSVQVCGLWPFAGGSSRPAIGVPVGQDILTGSTVCCDAFSWFKAGLVSSPSMLVLGLQGLGKSSWTVRQILGLSDQGIVSIMAGDLKGEYTKVVNALGGQVMRFGEGQQLNILDQGAMYDAANSIGGEIGQQLREMALQRAATMVATLVQVVRRASLADWELGLVARAVRVLDGKHRQATGVVPILPDLIKLVQNPPEDMVRSVLADTPNEYWNMTKPLNRSLQSLIEGPLGRTFSGHTTERIQLGAPAVSLDISAVARQSEDVLASVMLAAWSESFATIEAANALADAGAAPQRHFNTVMDEMWRPMRIEGAGLVDKLDAITRLNRNDGVGNIFITHSLKDMSSMATQSDNMKARGFAERSGIIVTAGLAKEDLYALSEVKKMTEVEIDAVASWSTPPGWRQRMIEDPVTGVARPAPPPGAGKVLIKLGERAGIQTQVKLTPAEFQLHDTNERWVKTTNSATAGAAA